MNDGGFGDSRLHVSEVLGEGGFRLGIHFGGMMSIDISTVDTVGEVRVRDISEVVRGIVEMNGGGHVSMPRDRDKRMERRMERCSTQGVWGEWAFVFPTKAPLS